METLTPDQTAEAVGIAWNSGRLKYKLQVKQKGVYDTIKNSPAEEIFCIVCSRGFGKTFIGSTFAIETALKNKSINILILSSTLKKLRIIVKPAFETLLLDCPPDLRPSFNSQDSVYRFPNGSCVYLGAAEKGHVVNLRGIHNIGLVMLDEVGFFGDEEESYPLDYVVEHILNPMFLRSKIKARTLMMSTPPDTPSHPFKVYFDAAKLKGCTASFDIYQSDIPPEKIAEAKARCRDPLAWRREYLCEWVVDTNRLIIPEWKESYVNEYNEKDPAFKYHNKYFSLDIGSVDKTVGHFAYYDFPRATLVIADEIVREGREWTTDDLANEIRAKEATRWGDGAKVSKRVGDTNNQILLSDLTRLHNLAIQATGKDSLNAMVAQARMIVSQGRVQVHPRCKLLIQSMRDGVWNAKKDEFGRTTALGHMDAIASFVYLVRNIDQHQNPIPVTYGYDPATQYWNPSGAVTVGSHALEKVFVNDNPFAVREAA